VQFPIGFQEAYSKISEACDQYGRPKQQNFKTNKWTKDSPLSKMGRHKM